MRKNTDSYVLILRESGVGNNDEQMTRVAQLLQLEYIKCKVRIGCILRDTLKQLFTLSKLLCVKYQDLYLGSYFSRWQMMLRRVVRFNKLYLMDDGVATFLAQKKMLSSGNVYDLFTYFDVDNLNTQEIQTHSFEYLRRRYQLNGTTGEHVFVGQILVEMGFLSLGDYKKLVTKVAKQCDSLIYIPHRSEDQKTVDEIASISNVKILRSDCSIEVYFLENGIYPAHIYSSISSALFTLSKIFLESRLTSILPSDLAEEKVEHFNEIVIALSKVKNIEVKKG
ncbi:hypothetical protein [Pseudoalteromonas maricaloris]|uniref:hypothetical protein n=1 Tax=Pseudoalteromonas maricaloris TaxID=184924 RepID=UPI003C2064E5